MISMWKFLGVMGVILVLVVGYFLQANAQQNLCLVHKVEKRDFLQYTVTHSKQHDKAEAKLEKIMDKQIEAGKKIERVLTILERIER